MKRYYRYSAIAGLALLVAACMELLNVTHPASAPVNTGVDATFEVKVKVDEMAGEYTTPVVGILAPEVWNLAENAVATYTTSDSQGVTHTMRLATAEDLGPKTTLPWPAYLKGKLGVQGNYEPMEWVVFIAETKHEWNDFSEFTSNLKVSFTTGEENLKTNLAYFIGNSKDGVDDSQACLLLHKQLFQTTGGDNDLIDYTMPKLCHLTPEAFTWEDIVALHYDATILVEGQITPPLKGADKVYLMARALYDNLTKEVVVDQVSEKTLMASSGKDKWVLYMYPHEFFGIPAGTKIDKVSFYMVNADKSIEVKLPDGNEFSFSEKNK